MKAAGRGLHWSKFHGARRIRDSLEQLQLIRQSREEEGGVELEKLRLS